MNAQTVIAGAFAGAMAGGADVGPVPVGAAMKRRAWRIVPDLPPVGHVVRIWWWGEGEIAAAFDGAQWRDEQGRVVRGPITHWREATT
jgi:hypothetical protein